MSASSQPALVSPSLASLLASDYAALYAGRPDSRSRRLLRAPLRFITNPSLHAVLMMRMALAGPAPLMGAWRHVLLAKHSIDLESGCELGPGLTLPHPFGIVLAAGVKVGANVLLYHNITVGGVARDQRPAPIIGDRVIIHTNTVIMPGAVVGSDAIIGANSLVEGHVPDSAVFRRGGSVPLSKPPR